MSGRVLTTAVFAILFVASGNQIVRALEVATIVNDSNGNVPLHLWWSNLPQESDVIVLAPGESTTVRGPDGATLGMRFNSTPALTPPREVKLRIVTARLPPGVNGAGYKSTFKQQTKDVVVLVGE
jgi:hypothetical protein